jgi:hypothetical protein
MSERDWIPAHRRLFKGAKKGWPRAVRFILLELCHEARPTNGVLEFPVEWDTLTAVHDRLGGNRKEIRVALAKLQETDATGTQVIQIERDQTEHRLKIVKWDSWSGPKSGAERTEDYRKREVEKRTASQPVNDVTPTGSDSTGQERRGSDAHARGGPSEQSGISERHLKSVPPPPPDPEPSEAAAPSAGTLVAARAAGNGAVASGDSESGYDMARRVWVELWEAKYKRPYEFTTMTGAASEDKVLQRVGSTPKVNPGEAEAYLRHKIKAYLRDPGDRNYLTEHCHPLRNLERDWVKYGAPKDPRRIQVRAPPAVEDPVSLDEMKLRAAAAMKRIGTGGI